MKKTGKTIVKIWILFVIISLIIGIPIFAINGYFGKNEENPNSNNYSLKIDKTTATIEKKSDFIIKEIILEITSLENYSQALINITDENGNNILMLNYAKKEKNKSEVRLNLMNKDSINNKKIKINLITNNEMNITNVLTIN